MDPIENYLAAIERHDPNAERPFVTLTYAQSLDGSISPKQGTSLKLSGRAALRMTHQLRASHDALLVGIGTVLADNPRLTTREVTGDSPQPVILDSHLRFPLDGNLMNHPKKPWIMGAGTQETSKKEQLQALGIEVRDVPLGVTDGLDLNEVLACLKKLGVKSVMVEGGAKVITNFLKQRLVDLVIITVAPVFLGGLNSISELMDLKQLPKIEQMNYKQFGEDVVVWGKLAPEEQ